MDIPPESLPIFARQTLSSFREPSVRLIVVIGAGIAGMAAARCLRALKYSVVVLEARDRFGGRIVSDRNGIDWSSNYFGDLDRNSALTTLCDSVGFDITKHMVRLKSSDALAYPLSGSSSLSLHYLRCGFYPILSRLCVDLEIMFNEEVVEVDAVTQAPFIIVKTRSGKSFTADAVVCTVPISVLQEGAINFIPSPFGQQLDLVRMEPLNNIILEFPSAFWPSSTDTFTLGPHIVFQSLLHPKKLPILIVTTSDPDHEFASVKDLVHLIMQVLRSRFPDASNPVAAIRTAWTGDRFARGAFPRRTCKFSDSAKWWKSDVTETSPLVFAGDACTYHRIGNIQTAIKSAWSAAEHLDTFFGKLSPLIPPWSLTTVSTKASSIVSSSASGAEISAFAVADSASPEGASLSDKSESVLMEEVEAESGPVPAVLLAADSSMEIEHETNLLPTGSTSPEPPLAEMQAEPAHSPEGPASANFHHEQELIVQGKERTTKSSKKSRGENAKKEKRDGAKAISKYIIRLVKEMGPNLKSKHSEYIQNRVTERMIEEWKAKGCISEFLNSDRKQRIRHFVQKYIDARNKSAKRPKSGS